LLNGVDSLAAGFANVVSFGITNKIRSTNKLAVANQEGWLYNLGTVGGILASLALNPAGAGAAWAKGLAAGYEGFGTVYGVLESTDNILKGEGSAWDALNFIPALKVASAFKRPRNVSSAIVETDAALAQVAKGTQCFVAGTEIQTLDGTKNIEDIHVGDWVLSDDPNTVGEIEYKQVLNTFVKETTNLVDIYIDGEKITTTEEHPFWVPDVGWVAAKDLHAGSLLQTKYESWLDVDRVEKHGGLTTVYNFEVQGFHTYFVSDLGLLVHNECETVSVYRKMSSVEAKYTLATMKLQPGKRKADPDKYLSELLGKVEEFQNANVPKGTDEVIIEFVLDKEGYNQLMSDAVKQFGSKGVKKVKYHYEGIDRTANPEARNIAIVPSKLAEFNNITLDVKRVNNN
jgi:Pretoxin HINT domain